MVNCIECPLYKTKDCYHFTLPVRSGEMCDEAVSYVFACYDIVETAKVDVEIRNMNLNTNRVIMGHKLAQKILKEQCEKIY